MKKIILLSFIFSTNAFSQPFDTSMYPGFYGIGAGLNGGPGAMGGGLNPNFTSSSGESVPMFDSTRGGSNFNLIKPNASCPLLTQTIREDQDAFLDIKNYLTSVAKKPECSSALNPYGAMMNGQSVSMLESLLGSNSTGGVKCYSKNIEQISSRNMAYYYAEKEIEQSMSSPYSSCSRSVLAIEKSGPISVDAIKECITKKYEYLVEENLQICKEVAAPQAVQDQINKGMVDLERILVQSLSSQNGCGANAKDAFKTTINTFLKVKALSAVGPWGAMAGFGADLIGNLLDKIFPNDSQMASALMDDILNEENFEQNACLYFNVQQKMYCANQPLTINLPNGSCNNVNVNTDLLKLLENVKALNKVATSLKPTSGNGVGWPSEGIVAGGAYAPGNRIGMMPPRGEEDLSNFESELDNLVKYALASESDIRSRVKTLPKIQQKKESVKLDQFYNLISSYQNYDSSKDNKGTVGQEILSSLHALVAGSDKTQRIDFEELVLKTTPGLKIDNLKQKGIANAIEQLLEKTSVTFSPSAETSRSMAKYNKYKNAMGQMARNQFESRLSKQFKEFETQLKFVSSKEAGKVNDIVTEGMLRNLVRHCTLMQEIYDPGIEGKMPKQCEKLGCGKTNKLNWFMPTKGGANLSQFKASYCDKSLGYKKIEDEYVKDLSAGSGAKICGKSPEDFF